MLGRVAAIYLVVSLGIAEGVVAQDRPQGRVGSEDVAALNQSMQDLTALVRESLSYQRLGLLIQYLAVATDGLIPADSELRTLHDQRKALAEELGQLEQSWLTEDAALEKRYLAGQAGAGEARVQFRQQTDGEQARLQSQVTDLDRRTNELERDVAAQHRTVDALRRIIDPALAPIFDRLSKEAGTKTP